MKPVVMGLPEDFSITESQARALDIDAVVNGASLEHGIFGTQQALGQVAAVAYERGDVAVGNALQLLVAVTTFFPPDDPRRAWGPIGSGTLGDGRQWRTAIPDDLSDAHIAALSVLHETIMTPVLRTRVAEVLWSRARPRNPTYARHAIDGYLIVANETFDPDHWVTSYNQIARAFALATRLGHDSAERTVVVRTALEFLDRLEKQDSLYYTQRLIEMLVDAVSEPAVLQRLLTRAQAIAEESSLKGDFNRARAYFDVTIPLARRFEQPQVAQELRLARAETYVAEALGRPSEMLRSLDLRLAVQALRRAGASRERREQIAQMLDEAQTLAITEMSGIGTPVNTSGLPDHVRSLLRGNEPIRALWLLAGAIPLPTPESARTVAEESLKRYVFAFGLSHRHLSADGRQEGETPGAIGATDDDYEQAVQGAMRKNAGYARVTAAFGVIEPGRRQLIADHDYSLLDIQLALQSRPFIPHGHEQLWAKGIHAGLIGEYDVAVHILAPHLENALREVLRRHGHIIYSTSDDGVQSLFSLERVLADPVTTTIFGSDIVFALEAALAERLGANMRNSVAHGIINDGLAQSHEAAFVWWIALRILRYYGPDALAQSIDGSRLALAVRPFDRGDPGCSIEQIREHPMRGK